MCTVMVVEDDRDIRDVIRLSAVHHGHKVMEAQNREEALNLAKRSAPDVITLDIRLQGDNGFSVLRSLRKAGYDGLAIVISAHRSKHLEEFSEWKDLRIFDVVDKPFEVASLLKTIEAAAEARKHENRLCRFLDNIIEKNDTQLKNSEGS